LVLITSHTIQYDHVVDSVNYWWFNVDEEMFDIATSTASRVVLAKEAGEAVLDYDPIVTTGGNGVSGKYAVRISQHALYSEYALIRVTYFHCFFINPFL